ncbi:hypothetical protein Y1Q_0013114 [Alligator mississippiensis]|uniref:Uncharacterized protein n=1 Tax=Alligator mississippiensis TaxID=8496 RepID=A0A151NHE9_ALLMI|nr:hypothetical protein Y1Q_0013114 [Alligator mississippiensis]
MWHVIGMTCHGIQGSVAPVDMAFDSGRRVSSSRLIYSLEPNYHHHPMQIHFVEEGKVKLFNNSIMFVPGPS